MQAVFLFGYSISSLKKFIGKIQHKSVLYLTSFFAFRRYRAVLIDLLRFSYYNVGVLKEVMH